MTSQQSIVEAQFSAVAERYRASAVHAQGADLARMAELVAARRPALLIDIGCGAGHAAAAVAPHCGAVVACDLSPAMLAQTAQLAAERGLANLTTREADVGALPFADASADAVVSRYSGHHWPDLPRAMAEIRRVLRPGGLLLISDIVAPDAAAADTFLQTIEYLRDRSHVRDYRIGEWQAAAAAAGLGLAVDRTWQVELAFADWVERMATPPAQVAMLRALLAEAAAEARAALAIDAGRFEIPAALLVG